MVPNAAGFARKSKSSPNSAYLRTKVGHGHTMPVPPVPRSYNANPIAAENIETHENLATWTLPSPRTRFSTFQAPHGKLKAHLLCTGCRNQHCPCGWSDDSKTCTNFSPEFTSTCTIADQTFFTTHTSVCPLFITPYPHFNSPNLIQNSIVCLAGYLAGYLQKS